MTERDSCTVLNTEPSDKLNPLPGCVPTVSSHDNVHRRPSSVCVVCRWSWWSRVWATWSLEAWWRPHWRYCPSVSAWPTVWTQPPWAPCPCPRWRPWRWGPQMPRPTPSSSSQQCRGSASRDCFSSWCVLQKGRTSRWSCFVLIMYSFR